MTVDGAIMRNNGDACQTFAQRLSYFCVGVGHVASATVLLGPYQVKRAAAISCAEFSEKSRNRQKSECVKKHDRPVDLSVTG